MVVALGFLPVAWALHPLSLLLLLGGAAFSFFLVGGAAPLLLPLWCCCSPLVLPFLFFFKCEIEVNNL